MLHTSNFPSGEIRGQFGAVASASSFQFNSVSVNVAETAGTVPVTVTRVGNTSVPAAVDYTISAGTAASPSDFIAATGTISFGAGEAFKIVTVSVVDDLYVEGNETIIITLSNPTSGAFLGSPSTATITIFNNDNVSFAAPQLVLEESGPDPNQATVVESVLMLRDPFSVRRIEEWLNLGSDKNTRVMMFSPDLRLNAGEAASSVTVSLIDANNQPFEVPAEDVRLVANSDLAQITFRLPDNIAAGVCSVRLKAHGLTSIAGRFRISF